MSTSNSCPVIAISGVKNSGKTTLTAAVVSELSRLGFKVAVIKHDGHTFDADVPGTDSHKHFSAGAYASAVYDGEKFSVVKRQQDLSVEELFFLFPEADLIILEGQKYSSWPKFEIVRSGNSSESVCDPKTLLGLVTDLPLKIPGVPVYGLNNIEAITGAILTYLGRC